MGLRTNPNLRVYPKGGAGGAAPLQHSVCQHKIDMYTMCLDFQFYYLMLTLFQTSMIYNGIFVFVGKLGDLHPPPTIFFSFTPAKNTLRTPGPQVINGYNPRF